MEFAGLRRSCPSDDELEVPDSEDEEAIERARKRRRVSPRSEGWKKQARQDTLTQMKWVARGATVPDSEDEDDAPLEGLESLAGDGLEPFCDEGDGTLDACPKLPEDGSQRPRESNAAQPQQHPDQAVPEALAVPREPANTLSNLADHDAPPTPTPKTPKRVRVAEVPSSQSPDVTPISIRRKGEDRKPVSPQSPSRNAGSTQLHKSESSNQATVNTWTQTQTTPSTRRKVMDFNARWAELSRTPPRAVKATSARNGNRRQADDQNTFALGEETQAALLEAEAALSLSDIYSDDEILGDPEPDIQPGICPAFAKPEEPFAPMNASELDAVDRSVVATPGSAANGCNPGEASAIQDLKVDMESSLGHDPPAETSNDQSDSEPGEDYLKTPIAEHPSVVAESQATAITCTPGDTSPADGLDSPTSSPRTATAGSSPQVSPHGRFSLGRCQVVEDSQDLPVGDLDEVTLSQLMQGSLMNSDIPPPPQWTSSIEYK
jgi:hypothetical protein